MTEPRGVGAYRRLMALAPAAFRRAYEDQAVETFAQLITVERRERGRLAARRLWMRAMVDGAFTVRRERAIARAARGGHRFMFTGFVGDVVYILRSWRHAKVFAVTSMLTVGLGLGLNAGIFAFADGFLFRPLPFDDADRLFRIAEPATISGGLNLDDYDAIKAGLPGLAGLAEWDAGLVGQIDVGNTWREFFASEVSPHFDQVMGFRLLLGRGFRDDEHQVLGTTPCWLSYAFWQSAFGGDERVLGRHFAVVAGTTRDFEVIGVLPPAVANFDWDNRAPDLAGHSANSHGPCPSVLDRLSYRAPRAGCDARGGARALADNDR
jgi:hypothetical protein